MAPQMELSKTRSYRAWELDGAEKYKFLLASSLVYYEKLFYQKFFLNSLELLMELKKTRTASLT